MNIVFFGTSEFAIPSFKALVASKHKVLALVTQPDRKKGRSLQLSPPPTKVVAAEYAIPVHQPEDASSSGSVQYLKDLSADIFVVISFGQILKKPVLDIPRIYSINVHGSLLPKYRGAAPTNWAVINGDRSSGVTVIKMNERMDEGDMILKREAMIGETDTNITLSEALSDIGAKALLDALDLIENCKTSFMKQDAAQATSAPKLKKEDGLIDWSGNAITLHNRVRGLLPWPGAYTHYEGKVLKILKTEIFGRPPGSAKAGEVLDVLKNKGIVVQTGSGSLVIQYLQLEGKKDMDADSFARGHRVTKGYLFI